MFVKELSRIEWRRNQVATNEFVCRSSCFRVFIQRLSKEQQRRQSHVLSMFTRETKFDRVRRFLIFFSIRSIISDDLTWTLVIDLIFDMRPKFASRSICKNQFVAFVFLLLGAEKKDFSAFSNYNVHSSNCGFHSIFSLVTKLSMTQMQRFGSSARLFLCLWTNFSIFLQVGMLSYAHSRWEKHRFGGSSSSR